jgi:hypothetical protein
VIPTMIANAWFMPRHLLPAPAANGEPAAAAAQSSGAPTS